MTSKPRTHYRPFTNGAVSTEISIEGIDCPGVVYDELRSILQMVIGSVVTSVNRACLGQPRCPKQEVSYGQSFDCDGFEVFLKVKLTVNHAGLDQKEMLQLLEHTSSGSSRLLTLAMELITEHQTVLARNKAKAANDAIDSFVGNMFSGLFSDIASASSPTSGAALTVDDLLWAAGIASPRHASTAPGGDPGWHDLMASPRHAQPFDNADPQNLGAKPGSFRRAADDLLASGHSGIFPANDASGGPDTLLGEERRSASSLLHPHEPADCADGRPYRDAVNPLYDGM